MRFSKVKNLFAVIVLSIPMFVVACGSKEVIIPNQKKVLDSNYVTGVTSKTKESKNENNKIHTFMADAFHNYGIYNVADNHEKIENWEFNGSYQGVMNYVQDSFSVTGFKGETVYSQLILVSKEEDISNLTIEVPQNDMIDVEVSKLGFTYNYWNDPIEDFRPWNTSFKDQPQRIADSILSFDSIEMPKHFVQPVWIKMDINEVAQTGIEKINVLTKINGDVISQNEISINILGQTIDENLYSDQVSGGMNFAFTDIIQNIEMDDNNKRIIGENDTWLNNPYMNFLSSEHEEVMGKKISALLERGQNFNWMWVSNNAELNERYNPVSIYDINGNDTGKVDNALLDGSHTGLVKWIYDPSSGEWDFDFTLYKKYITFLSKFGIESFWAANIAPNLDFIESQTYKMQYYEKQTNGSLILKAVNTQLYPPYMLENPSEWNWFTILEKFLNAYSQEIKSSEIDDVYIVLDEITKESVAVYQELFAKYDSFKTQSYSGWRWNIDVENKEEMSKFMGECTIKDDCVEEVVFGGYKLQELYPDLSENEKAAKFREISEARRSKGLKTKMYSSRSTYPSSLVQNDFGDQLWSSLYTKKYGFDGYVKWAADKWVDIIETDTGVGSNPTDKKINNSVYDDGGYMNYSPTGDEFIFYPSKEKGSDFVSSVRWELAKYSQDQAIKLTKIEKENEEAFNEIIDEVLWPSDPKFSKGYSVFENDFKWNTDYSELDFTSENTISASRVSIIAIYRINRYFEEMV